MRYRFVMFDWGDTVMKDHPTLTTPMVQWPEVETVEGIEKLLRYLRGSGRQIVLATGATESDVGDIFDAQRGGWIKILENESLQKRGTAVVGS